MKLHGHSKSSPPLLSITTVIPLLHNYYMRQFGALLG